MNMNKKKLLSLALVVVLIAILSFGTLAWFNDTDKVTNTFMVANSGEPQNPDSIFSVDVKEKVDNDDDGAADEGFAGEGDQAAGGTYKNILPGDKLIKQPFIYNTGAYDQYIRVHVTITNADAWIAAMKGGANISKIFDNLDTNKWINYGNDVYVKDDNTYTMTFYLKDILKAGKDVTLFDAIVIPSDLTQHEMAFIGGEFEMMIVAEAIQTENLGIDASSDMAAYEAFKNCWPSNP